LNGVGTNLGSIALSRLRIAKPIVEKVHGNSQRSNAAQHVYSIIDTATGDVYKFGISGGALNKNGSSRRANTQVNALNRSAGYSR
jgi:hypothetical protein